MTAHKGADSGATPKNNRGTASSSGSKSDSSRTNNSRSGSDNLNGSVDEALPMLVFAPGSHRMHPPGPFCMESCGGHPA